MDAEEFHAVLPEHFSKSGYTLMVARDAGVPVGFCYGYPESPEVWFGERLLPRIPDRIAATARLLALCELVVAPDHQRGGLGTALHDALIAATRPEFTSLHVIQDNVPAWSVYTRLGYEQVGVEPASAHMGLSGPVFDVLVLDTSGVADRPRGG
ncbi:GNAT family N-acetyltransferase [Yinghuangia sp. ASG 101]|nr:GNAT family N-acetyltransferase [Yinghuangia sp. ASG 101]